MWQKLKLICDILNPLKILCIPATSAPVERLFSTAGLTIANDRARLLPDLAEDIIFLHDVWPVIDKFVAADGLIIIID